MKYTYLICLIRSGWLRIFFETLLFSQLGFHLWFDFIAMAPKDPKQVADAASSGGGGGFFASIASSLSNFGSAMSKSVNGYESFGVEFWKLLVYLFLLLFFCNLFMWGVPRSLICPYFNFFNTARCKRCLLWKIIFLNWFCFFVDWIYYDIWSSLLCVLACGCFTLIDAWFNLWDSWLF